MNKNIFLEFEFRIKNLLQKLDLKAKKVNLSRVKVEMPKNPLHGDLSTNAALILAKDVEKEPRALAEYIASILRSDPDIFTINIAGPGFINIRLKNDFWLERLADLIRQGKKFGQSNIGKNIKINVEYVSANPTGPLHVGHCRGAVVGDVVANLLSFCGYDVVKEYYINDTGKQIENLSHSVFLRYCQALGTKIGKIPAGFYPGEYLIPIGKDLVKEFSDQLLRIDKKEALEIVGARAVSAMMRMIKADLASLNVYHDVFFSEKTLHANNAASIRMAIEDLTLRGYIYKGKLPPPKGQIIEKLENEDRDQILLRSTQVGDDMDRSLVKSDGSYTYFAADIAYFKSKYDRGFSEMIYILGADHGGYIKRLEAISQAVSEGKACLKIILCQLVRLYRKSEPIRMGKRTGTFVTLRDFIDEVGCDSVRFMMLYRKSDMFLDFDFVKVLEQSKDNPVFYVQYAIARCHSIFRQACKILHKNISNPECLITYKNRLIHDSEFAIIRKLITYPYLIERAAQNLEPHRLVFYLYDLAAIFHAHWNRGNEEANLRFIQPDDRTLTFARLCLVQAVANVLVSGLTLVGVAAPKFMHS